MVLEDLLNEFHAKPYAELSSLPVITTRKIETNKESIKVNIYRNSLEQEVIEIIVQIYISGKNLLFIKFAEVDSTGFRVSPNGSTEDVPNEVIYGYM